MKTSKIEKIYSRKNMFWSNRNRKKEIKIVIFLSVIILTINICVQSVEPIIDSKCREIATSLSSRFASEEVKKMSEIYQYDDISKIEKDEENNVKLIKIDVGLVNNIMAKVSTGVQKKLDQYEEEYFNIRLGSFLGSSILSGIGPRVKVRVQTAGNVRTDLKSAFSSQGINQTLHRIYINVICTTIVYTPFNKTEETVTSQILLAEAVIVGNIPTTYYELEGVGEDTALQVLE